MKTPITGKIAALLCALLMTTSLIAHSAEPRPFIKGSYAKLLETRQGKPFVLSFWSLDCPPCREELAMWGELRKKHPALEVVLVSTDTPEANAEITTTLNGYDLGKTESWVFADSFAARLRFEVDQTWRGELPRSYFFTRDHQVKAVTGKPERKRVEAWIAEQGISGE